MTETERVIAHLAKVEDIVRWNIDADARMGNFDGKNRWTAVLGHIENARQRLAA